jgi:hypothetical protein
MIDPQLHDWWSGKRLTEIRCDDNLISGAGVSLQVILPIFSENNLDWFSKLYGEFDDDLLLLGVNKTSKLPFEKLKYETVSPIQNIYLSNWINEYKLTDDICANLGIRFSKTDYSIEQKTEIAYQIFIHDNVFFSVEPGDEFIIHRLITNVLEQHSFYLGEEIDWSDVILFLESNLINRTRIELQSDIIHHCLRIPSLLTEGGIFFTDNKAYLDGKIYDAD